MRDAELVRSRWTDVDGARMHARVPRATPPRGAPTVILVHGIGVSSRYMAPLAARLGARFRVFAPDLPGFGRSDRPRAPLGLDALADALAAWMVAESIARASLVANSFGCQILVRLALRHRAKVDRLVLQGPTTDPDASVPRQIARWIGQGNREPFSLNGVILRDYAECGPRRVIAAYVASLRDPMRDELPRVNAPTLVVRGARDAIVPQRWAEEVARLLPRGRLVVLPGATHAINYAQPAQLARVITPFLIEGEEAHEPARSLGR